MKSRDEQWYDLFELRGTRRDFLRVGAAAAGLVALGSLPSCGGRAIRFSSDPFQLGVASGDPTESGVVLWTRLSDVALEGAGASVDRVPVEWEVAEDESFGRVVASGTTDALPELGHSAHAEVEGLQAGREYFYRLIAGGEASPIGRTKTAPARGAPVDALRMVVASCQHYEQGWFTALRHMADEDVDLVVHLGDYIYEGGPIPRVREHEGPQVMTLDDYRARYTTYKTDADLQAAHHSAPWIVTWDDHEVDNNYAGDFPEDDQSPEAFLLRRAAAYQAFYEFMPLRRTSMPTGPDMQLYRRFVFGDLIEMSVLDTRQYRTDQPCSDGNVPTCPAHIAPEQSILGARQREWLFEGLEATQARWNVLAQQVMVARLRRFEGEVETWAMDKWDGYPVERAALLDALAGSGAQNPVVLTGDIHSSWVCDLLSDFEDERSEVVGTEFVCTSLTSGGDGAPMTPWGQRYVDANPHVDYYDAQRGYFVATVTPELWTTDFRIVRTVSAPGGPIETTATWVVENGQPGAHEG